MGNPVSYDTKCWRMVRLWPPWTTSGATEPFSVDLKSSQIWCLLKPMPVYIPTYVSASAYVYLYVQRRADWLSLILVKPGSIGWASFASYLGQRNRGGKFVGREDWKPADWRRD